jgi:hypothetical protein
LPDPVPRFTVIAPSVSDMRASIAPAHFRGVTLAWNCRSNEEADAVLNSRFKGGHAAHLPD